MKKENRKKTVHYKRAVLSNSDLNLQEALLSVISDGGVASKVSDRQEKISSDLSGGVRLINKSNTYKTILFGQLVLFEQGKSQTLMTIDEDAKFYDIDSITSEQIKLESDGEATKEEEKKIKREFVESILYFGIYKNHVMVVQSKALQSKDLETHLNWILHSFTDYMKDESFLILQDKPTEETIKKMEESPVRKINLGSVPIKSKDTQDEIKVTGDFIEDSEKVRKVRFMPAGKGGSIIKAVLGENWFEDLNLEDSLDEANLQVHLEITYFRKTTKIGQKVLDSIASSMRNIDEDDVRIDLVGGGTIKGKDLKLSGSISAQYSNGLIDEHHLYLEMHKWLMSKISSGEIEVKR